jgi:CRISPR-associated protein Cmr4
MSGHLLAFYCETKTHAGGEESIGSVDLPIQRDPTTRHPEWYESTVKGAIKAHLKSVQQAPLATDAFGPDPKDGAEPKAGTTVIGAGSVAMLPFPTMRDTFWWATSPLALASIGRTAAAVGAKPPPSVPIAAGKDGAWAEEDGSLLFGGMEFDLGTSAEVGELSDWLLELVPSAPGYETFRSKLTARHVVVIADSLFSLLCENHKVIQPRNVLSDAKKSENLWHTEFLPSETLMVASIRGRTRANDETASRVVQALGEHPLLQIGGMESHDVGRIRVTAQAKPSNGAAA